MSVPGRFATRNLSFARLWTRAETRTSGLCPVGSMSGYSAMMP